MLKYRQCEIPLSFKIQACKRKRGNNERNYVASTAQIQIIALSVLVSILGYDE
jgi:hypothetical protein